MKALYFYHTKATFVEKDYQIFSLKFNALVEFPFLIKSKWSIPLLLFKQFWFLVFNAWNSQIIICQFVGYHSFFPVIFSRLLGKKCILIPGGIDCVKFESINYGNYTKKWLGIITNFCYRNASIICPVHECLVKSDYTYQDNDLPQQGIEVHCPNLKTPMKVIYNGYDPKSFCNLNMQRIPNSFITIASNLDNKVRASIKGIDLILQAAVKLPHCNFFLIGFSKNLKELPSNVTIVPFVENKKLPNYSTNTSFTFKYLFQRASLMPYQKPCSADAFPLDQQ